MEGGLGNHVDSPDDKSSEDQSVCLGRSVVVAVDEIVGGPSPAQDVNRQYACRDEEHE